jgi:hypothetical protein
MTEEYNPFQSPEAPPHSSNSGAAWPMMPFQSAYQRASIAIVLLAVAAFVCTARSIAAGVEYTSLEQLPDGSFKLAGTGATIAEGSAILSIASMILWLGTIVAFAMWTHRVAMNLPALGSRRLQYTPGWAVGWFFIPLANFVMPYFVAAEIWRESDPEQTDPQAVKTTSPLVSGWWFSYMAHAVFPVLFGMVFGGIIGYLAVSRRNADPHQVVREVNHYLLSFMLMALIGQAVGVLAAGLAILYVHRVTANQQAKFDRMHFDGLIA